MYFAPVDSLSLFLFKKKYVLFKFSSHSLLDALFLSLLSLSATPPFLFFLYSSFLKLSPSLSFSSLFLSLSLCFFNTFIFQFTFSYLFCFSFRGFYVLTTLIPKISLYLCHFLSHSCRSIFFSRSRFYSIIYFSIFLVV